MPHGGICGVEPACGLISGTLRVDGIFDTELYPHNLAKCLIKISIDIVGYTVKYYVS